MHECLFLSACGGGDAKPTPTPSPPPSPPLVSHNVSGFAVKGPLVNAEVRVYSVEQNSADFKGTLIASGKTGSGAQFEGINITEPLIDIYLIEVDSTEQTTDINTGSPPAFAKMVSALTKEQILNKTPINVSPLNSLVIESLSGKSLSTESMADSVKLLSETVYLGANEDINPFTTNAILLEGESDLQVLLQHRTIIESFSMTLVYLAKKTGLRHDNLMSGFARDIADGIVDGKHDEEDINLYVEYPSLLDKVLAAPVRHLPIKGSSVDDDTITSDPYLVADVAKLLVDEQSVIGSELTSPELASGNVVFQVASYGADSDLDGYPNIIDGFPEDPTEFKGSDEDAIVVLKSIGATNWKRVGSIGGAFYAITSTSLVENSKGVWLFYPDSNTFKGLRITEEGLSSPNVAYD